MPTPPPRSDIPPRIVVIGSLNMDLVIRAPRFPRPGETIAGGPFATHCGGKGANQALAARRLAAPHANIDMIGCVGDDPYGRAMRDNLAREGVSVHHLHTLAHTPSGVGVIQVDDSTGENSIIVALGANLHLTIDHINAARDLIERACVIILQLEIPHQTIESFLRHRDQISGRIILNAAPAPPPGAFDLGLLRMIDVLVLNESEARSIAGVDEHVHDEELIQHLPVDHAADVILTRGSRGSTIRGRDGRVTHHGTFGVTAVDSTAAGDAFVGALAVAIAERGFDGCRDDVIRFACAAGALAATKPGAQPSLPSRADVERLIETHTTRV